MKTPYPRIFAALTSEPWLLHQPVLHALYTAAMNHERLAALPMEDDEEEEEECRNEGGVLVLPIRGILGHHLSLMESLCGGVDTEAISGALTEAASDSNVGAVLLDIDSPGGRVTGIPELGRQIAAFPKPIHTFTSGTAASAALWLAVSAKEFRSTPSAGIGSVGVYTLRLDESRALENDGLKVNAIVSGKHKLTGASFKPMTDEEEALLQASVDKIGAEFRSWVKAHSDAPDDALQGQMFDGNEAADLGFTDARVESIASAIGRLQTLIS